MEEYGEDGPLWLQDLKGNGVDLSETKGRTCYRSCSEEEGVGLTDPFVWIRKDEL